MTVSNSKNLSEILDTYLLDIKSAEGRVSLENEYQDNALYAIATLIEGAKPDWSNEKHASNDAQMAYALGGKTAIEKYEQNLKELLK